MLQPWGAAKVGNCQEKASASKRSASKRSATTLKIAATNAQDRLILAHFSSR